MIKKLAINTGFVAVVFLMIAGFIFETHLSTSETGHKAVQCLIVLAAYGGIMVLNEIDQMDRLRSLCQSSPPVRPRLAKPDPGPDLHPAAWELSQPNPAPKAVALRKPAARDQQPVLYGHSN
jgi:hypothetical protein